nr:unnamed protein product [Digitaria exilis]
MVASIRVFYALVLCQGSLYIMACIMAFFSVLLPRWSLAQRLGDDYDLGARAVNLYYERAYTTRIEIGVFAEDTISLASFAVDSLDSASNISHELQLVGVRILHCLLQQKRSCSSNEELISVITRSEKSVPTLINMLGWTFNQDKDIRLFAVRVTAHLASYLKIAGNAGAVRLVSSLLDAENQLPYENDEGNGDDASIGQPQSADGDHEIGGRTRNEAPLTSQDSLPVLGMMILERLACDPDNCAEIVKNTNLVTKIINLICYTSNNRSSNDNALIISSSLNFVRMISTTNGKVGATLRQELCENPFLLTNLKSVLEDRRSIPEVWKLAIDIIAAMALDESARNELASVQVIIHKLLHIFIVGQDGPTNYDQSLRVAAGGALANHAMESPENCLVMLEEQLGDGYDLAKDLVAMLRSDEYTCVAVSLLQNLCECSRMGDDELPTVSLSIVTEVIRSFFLHVLVKIKNWLSDPWVSNQLSSALQVVLQNIMAAEGKQLEALIGLASQICYVLPPQPFVQVLESHIIGTTIAQKLVNTLNSNKKPSHEYPRMRRAIVHMVISVLRRYPGYAIIFSREGMIDALSKVEMTPSKVEKYRVFLGNEGVVLEHGLPLRELATTAKSLIHHATPT